MLINFLFATFLIFTILMVVLILLQQGKGADAGAAFGGGQSVFSGRTAANMLTRLTVVCACVFFIVSLSLTVLYYRGDASLSVVSGLSDEPETQTTEVPLVPEVPLPVVPEVPKPAVSE